LKKEIKSKTLNSKDMPVIIQYLLKLSLSVAVIHAFYYLFLRRLTFYNLNRWYLLGYTILCFVIPFINVAEVANKADKALPVINYIPSVQHLNGYYAHATIQHAFTMWDAALYLSAIGAIILMVRMAIQLGSFLRIKNKAVVISDQDTVIYHVDEQIAPFSFGNSIYLNKDMHTDRELEEIILHEYVHVKQRHTIDILLAELLCVVNWYNPFAWFMRHSIRQNLEFIADDNVVRSGMDRKAYQYHLLKVVGIPQYRIANQFNFSSLKKRIMMMNRSKTTKIHLVKFLFILPLMAVILLAFRSEISTSIAKSNVIPAAVKKVFAASPQRVFKDSSATATAATTNIKDTTIKAPGASTIGSDALSFTAQDSTLVDKQHNVVSLFGNATIKNITGSVTGPVIVAELPEGGGDLDISKALVMVDGKISTKEQAGPAVEAIIVLRSTHAISLYGDKARYGAILYNTRHSGTAATYNTVYLSKYPAKYGGAYTGTLYGDTLIKTRGNLSGLTYSKTYSGNYANDTAVNKGSYAGGTSVQTFSRSSSPGNGLTTATTGQGSQSSANTSSVSTYSIGVKPGNSFTAATKGQGTQSSTNTSSVSTWSIGVKPGNSFDAVAKGQGTQSFNQSSSPGKSWSVGVKSGSGLDVATSNQSGTGFSGHPTATASVNPSAVIDGSVLSTGENDIMYLIDPKNVQLNQLNGMTRFFKENGFLLNFGEQYQAGKLQKLTVSIAIDNAPKAPSASATYDIDQMQDGKYVIRVRADRKTKDVSVVLVLRKGR
jgi:beta-lactamase regulating signal transducer with metallopeptidase domain